MEERENRSREGNKSSLASLLPPKRPGHEDEEREAPNVDVDDPLQDDENIDSNSDDDSEDEAALMAELAAIKKERAAERAENEARQKAEQVSCCDGYQFFEARLVPLHFTAFRNGFAERIYCRPIHCYKHKDRRISQSSGVGMTMWCLRIVPKEQTSEKSSRTS